MPPSDEARALRDVVALLTNSIALVRIALENHNPNDAERRDLEQVLLQLVAQQGVKQAQLNLALAGNTQVQAPTAPQVTRVAELAGQVQLATAQASMSAQAIALGSNVVDLATKIVRRA